MVSRNYYNLVFCVGVSDYLSNQFIVTCFLKIITREVKSSLFINLFINKIKKYLSMPCGKKRKRHKIATHKRKKRLRKNRHKKRNK